MSNQSLWDEMELIQVKTVKRSNTVSISDNKCQFFIPSSFMKELGWVDGERVNLYCTGNMFAIRPHRVGLLTIKRPKDSSGRIYSKNFCIEIMSRTKSCREFEAWVDAGVLWFMPKKGEQ